MGVMIFMMSTDIKSIAIINIHGVEIFIIVVLLMEREAINLLENAD